MTIAIRFIARRGEKTGCKFGSIHRVLIKIITHRVWKFHLKFLHAKKYDHMLCQSRLHTASEIFVYHKFGSGLTFALFASMANILRGFDSSEPPYM